MNRVISWLNHAAKSLKRNFLAHPAVSISLIFTAVAGFIIIHGSIPEHVKNLTAGLIMVPWTIMLALVMDQYMGKSAIKPSLVSLLVIAAGMCFPARILEWILEPSFIIIYVLPLVLVTYRKRVSDKSFISEIIWQMFSLVAALLVALLFMGITAGIITACRILFDMPHSLEGVLYDLVYSVALALGGFVFISVGERENYRQINMLVQPVTNYLIAPALLIYTAVLFVYILKIVIEQTLPDGGVANMCIMWLLFSLYVAASQQVFQKQPYMWFGKIYGYVAVPIIIMLWVAAFRRVSDYGITPGRYYLLLSALIATVCVVITFFRRKNLYYIVAVCTAVVFTCSVFLPWVNYSSVTGYSQVRIIRAEADALGKLHDDGTIDSYGYVRDDDHGKKIISAVSLLKEIHPASLLELGLTKDSDITAKTDVNSNEASTLEPEREMIEPDYINLKIMRTEHTFSTGSHSKVLFEAKTSFADGLIEICIPGGWSTEIRCSDFINRQLGKCGLDCENATVPQLKSHEKQLQVYEGDGYMLILDEFCVHVTEGKRVDTNWVAINVKAVLFE